MAANNFYLSLTRAQAQDLNLGNVTAAASGNAGPAQSTSADIELRMQTDTGSGTTGLKKKDVVQALQKFIAYIESNGPDNDGTYLPAL